MSVERVMVMFHLEREPIAKQFSLFDLNAQTKHKTSRFNLVIGLFNLKMKNSERYNRIGYFSEA